jgi:hypothetical protein
MDSPRPATCHRVVFVNDNGQALAVPGTLVAKQGDEVVFQAVDVGPVSLVFPGGVLTHKDGGGPVNEHHLEEHASATFIALLDKHRSPGIFAYAAYCRGLDQAAVGNSQPKIIIYQ